MATVDDMIRIGRHALARDLSHGLSWLDVVNEAGEHFVNLHPWKFLEYLTANASTKTGQPWIDLPEDFREFIVEPYYNSLSQSVVIVTQNQMLLHKSHNISSTSRYMACLAWKSGPNPKPVMEIHPVPITDDLDGVFIKYRGGWKTLKLDTDIIPVPNFCLGLFKEVMRATTLGIEEQEDGTVAARITQLKATSVFVDAASVDGRAQGTAGRLQGGAAEIASYQKGWSLDDSVMASRS